MLNVSAYAYACLFDVEFDYGVFVDEGAHPGANADFHVDTDANVDVDVDVVDDNHGGGVFVDEGVHPGAPSCRYSC